MQIAPGTMVDRYHVLELLGEGGMAVVYKATDTRLKREVALKLIRSEVFPPAILEQVLARFEREATALARMQHPNILTVFDFGEYNHAPYLVSEYLAGGTLRQRMGRQIPASEATVLLAPVAEALAYAHSVGVIHRDVKPANVLFTETGTPKLADFGIARLLGMDASTQLTGTGMGMGTPAYMAPEQWHGDVTPAVDTYAMGVVLYEMLTGRLPFEAQTPVELAIMMATKPLPDPRQYAPGLPDDMVIILHKSLQTNPVDRYSTMQDFAHALKTLRPTLPGISMGAGAGSPSGATEINNGLPQTEVDRLARPFTPAGGVPQPTPGSPWPPPGSSQQSQPDNRPITRPPTYPPGGMPTRQTPASAFDSGATFQTPPGVYGGERTNLQTPAGGQPYQTPPPYSPPSPSPYTPVPEYQQPQADARKGPGRTIAIIAVLAILCLVVVGGASWYAYQQYTQAAFRAKVSTGLALTAAAEQAAAATAASQTETARQATAQAGARQTEAAQLATAQAEATRSAEAAAAAATRAAIPVPLQGPLTWPVLYDTDFAADDGAWTLGEEEDDFASILRANRNGMFIFEMTAKQGVASRSIPDTPSGVDPAALTDFYLAVDAAMSGPESMKAGIVFGYDRNSGYYAFMISRSGNFGLWSYSFSEQGWTNVVQNTPSTAISINGINRIEVVGRGNRYYIYVNRTLLVDTSSDLHLGGWMGVITELSNAGDQGEWRFDNFEVRAP